MRPPVDLTEFERQRIRDEFAIAALPALIVANAILFAVNRVDIAERSPVAEAYRLADEALCKREAGRS